MAARIVAGILGGIAGVIPLLAVNLAASNGLLDTGDVQAAALSGAGALLGGVLLGGIVAGAIAGRRGGGIAGAVAGSIAAALYAVVVIGLVVGGARQGHGPPIIAAHPIRTSGALLFVAALVMGVSVVVGWIAGRGHGGRSRDGMAGHYDARSTYAPDARRAATPAPRSYSGPPPSGGRPPSAPRPPVGVQSRPPDGRSAPRNWR